ncbi:class I SAM-dependent methyltransferase [Planctomicrobium sp. SH664]|uniref:class I SAM-dependent methyltransferase n=1 Tax=Planctomicrobium sp. SH664 TaxID=3448125 RepID=UPI003F5B6351
MSERQLDELHIPVSERLAMNASDEVEATRILCTTVGRGQTAAALAERLPQAQVVCNFLDIYPAEDARDLTSLPNLSFPCEPDLPAGEVDLFVLPASRGGEAELTRDLLQQGFDRLKIGGQLIATVDNAKDTWLHHEIEKLGKNLDRTPKRHGVVYRLKKLKPLKRFRDFSSEFAFRDGERLIKAVTRPGVFAHRRADAGARVLIQAMQVNPGDFVLDIGCGSGSVGFAAGLRDENVRVHAVDSNVRAVEAARRGAELNGLTAHTTQLDADGGLITPQGDLSGQFDVVVGNPPYFSHYQIAEIFLQAAKRGLKPGGRVYIVTKYEEWLMARMEQLFGDVQPQEARGYTIVTGVQR